ncbi:S41 family peptidase [Spirosoma arcticum]
MKYYALLPLFALWLMTTVSQASPKNDPERNFEAFWHLFNRHYAHFDGRGVDWKQQYQRFRPMVNPQTTDEQLLAIFNDMVAPLKDGHVVVSPTGDLPASAKYARFYQEFPTKELQRQFHQVTLANLSKAGFGAFTPFQSAPYQIGGYCRSNEYGYLQINGFGGMSLSRFTKQLDEMIADFSDVKGLILDIRINGGGSPEFLYALVGRLTQVKRLVGYGRTRISKRRHEYTPWGAYYVPPQGEKQLVKPTLLLTSGATISAGDHCALYLNQFPYVRLIGENTNGIFSPMLGKKLPNGWEISLSNGQTVSAKRINFEGKGVPADIMALHHRKDMLQGNDPVLEEAIRYLETNQTPLTRQTICYEQIALNFFTDSLLRVKAVGDITPYSTGLVEEDATLLAPFARNCYSLTGVYEPDGVQARISAEQVADSTFYQQNVKDRFYVNVQPSLKRRKRWPFAKRTTHRLTVAHHITLKDKQYVRLHLSQSGGKGKTVLIVLDRNGAIVEHCALTYNYLSSHFYQVAAPYR